MEPFDSLKPPTDNLYKFMALFGLIVYLGAAIGPAILVWYSQTALLEYQHQSAILNSKFHPLTQKVIELQKHSVDPTPAKVSAGEQNDDLNTVKEAAEEKRRYLEMLISQTNNALVFAKVFFVLGSTLTVAGFMLWYSKVQHFEDLKLRHEALRDDAKIATYERDQVSVKYLHQLAARSKAKFVGAITLVLTSIGSAGYIVIKPAIEAYRELGLGKVPLEISGGAFIVALMALPIFLRNRGS